MVASIDCYLGGETASKCAYARTLSQCWQGLGRGVDDQVSRYGGVLVVDDDLVMVETRAYLQIERGRGTVEERQHVESGN